MIVHDFRLYVGTDFPTPNSVIDNILPKGTIWDWERSGEGVWNSVVEPMFVLRLYGVSDLTADISAFTLAAYFNQDSVLVTRGVSKSERGRTMASPRRYSREIATTGNRTLLPDDGDTGYRYVRNASGDWVCRLITQYATSHDLT